MQRFFSSCGPRRLFAPAIEGTPTILTIVPAWPPYAPRYGSVVICQLCPPFRSSATIRRDHRLRGSGDRFSIFSEPMFALRKPDVGSRTYIGFADRLFPQTRFISFTAVYRSPSTSPFSAKPIYDQPIYVRELLTSELGHYGVAKHQPMYPQPIYPQPIYIQPM